MKFDMDSERAALFVMVAVALVGVALLAVAVDKTVFGTLESWSKKWS